MCSCVVGPEVKVASTVASGDGAREHTLLEMEEKVTVLVSSSSGFGSVSISPGSSSWAILYCLVSRKW